MSMASYSPRSSRADTSVKQQSVRFPAARKLLTFSEAPAFPVPCLFLQLDNDLVAIILKLSIRISGELQLGHFQTSNRVGLRQH